MSTPISTNSSATLQVFPAGSVLIPQGGKLGTLFVLRSGELEVVRDGALIRSIDRPGAVFGEMSVLLDSPHSATVKAVTEVSVYVIANALDVMLERPQWSLQLARMLAQRLETTTAALVDSQNRATGFADMIAPAGMMKLLGDPEI